MNKPILNNQITSQIKKGILAIERRKYPRYVVELPFDYTRIDGKEIYGGIVFNASEGGILVYLPERIEIGALLQIEIIYMKGLELDGVKAISKVVWSDLAPRESWEEQKYGLQFQYIDEENYKRLMALLREIGK